MHNEGGVLVDRTTSRTFSTRTICGTVTTLSPFVLAEQVDVSLPSITGLVEDSSGNPLSNVQVRLSGVEERTAETDIEGVFRFVNLTPGGNYNVQPRQPGYLFDQYSEDFTNLTDENTVAFMGIQSNFSISGRVTDENGNGISGAAVLLDGAIAAFVTTDKNGNYAFADIPADGLYRITPLNGGDRFAPAEIFIDAFHGDLADIDFQVTTCGYSLTFLGEYMPARGGGGSFNVATLSSCAWLAQADAPWIVIVSAEAGSGDGTVAFEVRENFTASARLGTISVGGQIFTVLQEGLGASCGYSVSPPFATHEAGGESGSANVTTAAECGWQATSNQDWIVITSSNVGIGNGGVTYNILPNTTGVGRAGVITIGGQKINVKQKGS
jgi:hypothetical protein